MSEMTPTQFKMATVVDQVVAKSPRFGGELRFAPLPGDAIRVDWNDVDLVPHSFEIRLHEIEKCKDMEAAIEMILGKMGPGHIVKHRSRKTKALTPDLAPPYTPSIDPRHVFQQRVVACDRCETLGTLPSVKCRKLNCGGTMHTYRVVQPKFPGQFKPFKERIEDDANQLHSSEQPGPGPGGRPGPTAGRGEGVGDSQGPRDPA